jgi:hypothetical protein
LAGTSTARTNFFGTTLSSLTQIEGTGGSNARGSISVLNNDVSNNPPYVLLGRSGAATLGSNAAVVSGSRLGTVSFHGADGTSFIEAATVAGEVDGTPGSNDMPGRLVFSTTADGAASPTERLRITSTGAVGIGSSSPGGLLEVKSADQNPNLYRLYNAYNAGASSWGVDFYRDTDSGNNLSVAEIKAVRTGGNASELKFGTSSTPGTVVERVRIGNDGTFYLKTAGSTPSSSVSGTAWGFGSGTNDYWINAVNSTGTANHWSFVNGNGTVGSITTNGSATAYNTSSDYRLKENIVPLTGAVDRVNQLQVHRFNFITDPDKTVDGFIAHEAQAVVPECVTGEKDAVDVEGSPVYQGIDQSKLVPLLTAALQEAIAKIETLEARLTAAGIA